MQSIKSITSCIDINSSFSQVVILATGTIVTIKPQGPYINVWIMPSAKDFDSTQGLETNILFVFIYLLKNRKQLEQFLIYFFFLLNTLHFIFDEMSKRLYDCYILFFLLYFFFHDLDDAYNNFFLNIHSYSRSVWSV